MFNWLSTGYMRQGPASPSISKTIYCGCNTACSDPNCSCKEACLAHHSVNMMTRVETWRLKLVIPLTNRTVNLEFTVYTIKRGGATLNMAWLRSKDFPTLAT